MNSRQGEERCGTGGERREGRLLSLLPIQGHLRPWALAPRGILEVHANPFLVPAAVAALLTSGRFRKEPNVGYVGYTGALGFSEQKAAIGAELLHLVKTMSAVPYDPAVSRALCLEFAALSRTLVSGATDELKDIGTAIRAGSVRYYLFRFLGVERSYVLGLQLALSSVRNFPSYTNSAYEIKYRTDLNTAQFEYDVANRLIDYNSHFLDYVRAAIRDTETLCGLQKFSCLAETN